MRQSHLFRSIAALLVLTLACGCSTTQPPPAPTGMPTAIVTAAPVGPGGLPATPLPGGLCENLYFPVVADAAWQFIGSIGPVQYQDDEVLSSVEEDGFEVSHQVNLLIGGQTNWTEPWQCTSEGLVRNPSSTDLVSLGMGFGSEAITVLAVEGVTVPQSIEQGDTWTQVQTFELMESDDHTLVYTLTYVFHAGPSEQLTVSGGTFEGQRIDVQASWTTATDPAEAGSAEITEWFVPGVGLVKWASTAGGSGELASYVIP